MAEEKKSFFANAWSKVKEFFGKLWIKVKAIKWKELWHEGCTRIVKPVVAYSVVGGVAVVVLVVGILCACLCV